MKEAPPTDENKVISKPPPGCVPQRYILLFDLFCTIKIRLIIFKGCQGVFQVLFALFYSEYRDCLFLKAVRMCSIEVHAFVCLPLYRI